MSPQSEPSHVAETPLGELEARLIAEQNRHHEEFRQFAYAVSHDLREPIRMIVSYSQLLDRRYQEQLNGDGQDFMRYIQEAAQRLDRLLGDLLTYSHQFRSPDQPLESVEPEGALQGAILMIDAAVAECGAQITNDPLPAVLFDFAQLTQVFRQLIMNAITFRGPEPPKIHVSASRYRRRNPILRSRQRDRDRSALSRANLRRLQTTARPRFPGHGHRFGNLQAHHRATGRTNLGGV